MNFILIIATEDQSKKVQHEENETVKDDEEMLTNDELMDDSQPTEENPELNNIQEEQISETNKNESTKEKGFKSDRKMENCDAMDEGDIEGEIQDTHLVPRSDETTAHCS